MMVFEGIALCILSIVLLIIVANLISKFKNARDYRKYLVDLLVAGKIRQIATKEKVDLLVEEKLFLECMKKSKKRRLEQLDEVIEQELMDEIDADITKK